MTKFEINNLLIDYLFVQYENEQRELEHYWYTGRK